MRDVSTNDCNDVIAATSQQLESVAAPVNAVIHSRLPAWRLYQWKLLSNFLCVKWLKLLWFLSASFAVIQSDSLEEWTAAGRGAGTSDDVRRHIREWQQDGNYFGNCFARICCRKLSKLWHPLVRYIATNWHTDYMTKYDHTWSYMGAPTDVALTCNPDSHLRWAAGADVTHRWVRVCVTAYHCWHGVSCVWHLVTQWNARCVSMAAAGRRGWLAAQWPLIGLR